MPSVIKQVFYILGVMALSLLLWGFLFGNTGRTLFWSVMEPVFEKHWAMYTMNDGKIVNDTLGAKFTELHDFNTNE